MGPEPLGGIEADEVFEGGGIELGELADVGLLVGAGREDDGRGDGEFELAVAGEAAGDADEDGHAGVEVEQGGGLAATLAKVTSEPVRVLGDALGSLASSAGRLVEGGVADVCVFDPAATWTVTPESLRSQGKHTPFGFADTGMALPGRVRCTLVAGTVAHELPAA
jgi:hypothetical protein